jgi:hypothetical protein
LDPLESGFVDTRRFLIIHTKLVPLKQVEVIQVLKLEFSKLDVDPSESYITIEDFLTRSYWFEVDAESDDNFNRPQKLKSVLARKF